MNENKKPTLLRVTTVPRSLWKLLEGQLRFMTDHFIVHAVSSEGEHLDIVRDRENVEVYSVNMARGISPLQDLKSIVGLYRYVKKIKPDIIHTHTPKAGLIGMVVGSIANVPIKIHTIAGMPLESTTGFKRMVLIFVEKIIYKLADKIYPNSKGLNEFIIQNKLTSESKLKIIGNGSSNGINLSHFKETEEIKRQGIKIKVDLKLDPSDFVFLFIGRIVKDKGVEELLWAFDKISEKDEHAKLLILGRREDDLDPISERSNEILKENKNILFIGYQLDIRPYLSLGDTFVFPTYREGLPNVLLQACAFNLPIIATKVTGNTDIIENNKNGVLVEAKSGEALFKKMILFKEDKKLRDHFSEKARPFIEARYGQELVW